MTAPKTWKDPSIYVKEIHVEESCMELDYTREILIRADLPYTVIPDRAELPGIEG
ncbi:MAG TPA: DNA photolyase, partial [Desulfobacterales bacterium]|nr:DNA photolyase [Desulfobacterales bacterium]